MLFVYGAVILNLSLKEVDEAMGKRVGFIGLGAMGNPMSKNLLKAGFDLTVWNRTESKMKEIVELGAKSAHSAKEVAQNSEVTITMLTAPSDVEQVILQKDGVLEGLKPGAAVIDMSTISPEVSKRIASNVANTGTYMLDAPVSGSIGTAAMAALTILVGGEKKVFENHKDVLAGLGKNIFYIGLNGMGCYVKLVSNAIMGTHMASPCRGDVPRREGRRLHGYDGGGPQKHRCSFKNFGSQESKHPQRRLQGAIHAEALV